MVVQLVISVSRRQYSLPFVQIRVSIIIFLLQSYIIATCFRHTDVVRYVLYWCAKFLFSPFFLVHNWLLRYVFPHLHYFVFCFVCKNVGYVLAQLGVLATLEMCFFCGFLTFVFEHHVICFIYFLFTYIRYEYFFLIFFLWNAVALRCSAINLKIYWNRPKANQAYFSRKKLFLRGIFNRIYWFWSK